MEKENLDIHVSEATQTSIEKLPIEIVERKGFEHPDTLTDRAAEETSVQYSRYCLENFGYILHHNVDKAVLIGGQSRAWFGGGEIIAPIQLVIVGRAAYQNRNGQKIPMDEIVARATAEFLRPDETDLRESEHIQFDYKIRPGALDLVENFERGQSMPLANDTSFGVAYHPLSETEKIVYATEKLLNHSATKQKFPQIGKDIKVMGVRHNNLLDITVAAAFVARHTPNRNVYDGVKEEMRKMVIEKAAEFTNRKVRVFVNTADGDSDGAVYLTVTGTSAECGDDGQVGRGNRANGLITPYRPMTLEATAGKNPVSHVGKSYNVTAKLICQRLCEAVPEISEVSCYLVSQIGKPINQPQAVNVRVRSAKPISFIQPIAQRIITETLDNWAEIRDGFLARRWELF
jgi:S-adenosylmethionine synthetase